MTTGSTFIPPIRSVRIYLTEIEQYKRLSLENERALGKQLKGETCLETLISRQTYMFARDYAEQAAVEGTAQSKRQWAQYIRVYPEKTAGNCSIDDEEMHALQKLYRESSMHYQQFIAVSAAYLREVQKERKERGREDLSKRWKSAVSAPSWFDAWNKREEAIDNALAKKKKKPKQVLYFSPEFIERADEEAQNALYRAYSHLVEVESTAAQTFITSNLRLVVHIAKQYLKRGLELPDLIQYGNLGLMHAVGKFDYDRGCKFSTHASWWIRQAILRGIENDSTVIRIPVHYRGKLHRLPKLHKKCTDELNRKPTEMEFRDYVAQELGISSKKADELLMRKKLLETDSLDRKIGNDPDSTVGALYIPSEVDEKRLIQTMPNPPGQELDEKELIEVSSQILQGLSSRSADVLRMRLGIGDEEEHTLGEIGKKYGLTRERVRQIEGRALDKIRESKRTMRKLTPFLN